MRRREQPPVPRLQLEKIANLSTAAQAIHKKTFLKGQLYESASLKS